MTILKTSENRWASRAAATIVAVLFSFAAGAEPITLKLSFFSSDRSPIYLGGVKPFVDAVNREGEGFLKIDVYFSDRLNPHHTSQPQVLLDGAADIALVASGETPEQFPDSAAIALPGLFRDKREATRVYTLLAARGVLRGYQDFFVITAVTGEPEIIHSRKPIASLAGLKGQKLRVDNVATAAAMAKLGATPVLLPVNEVTPALSSGRIDGAVIPLAPLLDFGIGRMVNHHYFLTVGVAPLALLMNRKVFEGLPDNAKALIRKYSGEWAAERWLAINAPFIRAATEQLVSNPQRTTVVASTADREVAQRAFDAVAEEWAAASPRNRELLERTRAEIAKIRSSN